MRQHGPESFEHSRRQTWPEQWNVPFNICPYKVFSPAQAYSVVWSEIAAGKAASCPKLEERRLIGGQFQDVERTHIDVGDSSSKDSRSTVAASQSKPTPELEIDPSHDLFCVPDR